MKRSIATLILLFILLKYAITQPQNHKWIYNWSNVSNNDTFDWTGASVIDFNILPPGVYKDSDIHLDISEAYGSICSEFGEFLFYSNGQQINGSSHKAITNGDTINYGPRWEVFQFTDVDSLILIPLLFSIITIMNILK